MSEALALLEKYEHRPKRNPCPDSLRALLKELSDFAQRGRKLSRESLLDELRKQGHTVGRKTLAQWIEDAGGKPWFSVR